MNRELILQVCEHFARELHAILETSDFPQVSLHVFPARCGFPPLTKEELAHAPAGDNVDTECIGSCCLKNMNEEGAGEHIRRLDFCFRLLVPGELVEHYMQQGAYLVTPGWLEHWKRHVQQWGGSRDVLREMFAETTKQILLLDTGLYPNSNDLLRDFAEYLGLPAQALPVGIDYLRLYVNNMITRWMKANCEASSHAMQAARQQDVALYAMALDLLGSLPVLESREDVFEKIVEVLTLLFGSTQINALAFVDGFAERVWCSAPDEADEGEVWDRLIEYEDKVGYTENKRGFYFKVNDTEDTLLTIELQECAVPKNIPRYMNLCDALSGVFALAVTNGRTYEKLKEALDKVETLRGIIPICSHCKQIRTDQGAWEQIENYISTHSLAEFSHSICPSCMEKYYPEVLEKRKQKAKQNGSDKT